MIVLVTGVSPVFHAANDAMLLVPLGAKPRLALVFIHMKDVALPPKPTTFVAPPLHTVCAWFVTPVTVGVGLTVIRTFVLAPVQSTPLFK